MAYDFSKAVDLAKSVVDQQNSKSGGENSYTYPLVYPQQGNTIIIRPLFNPASGQIIRLVNRHEKVPCYKTYGIECPICKVMQEVKDMTGQDPFGRTKSSKSRGLCFAQYISSSNQIDLGNNRGTLQPGEIILMMFPWSVYSQLNTMIQSISQVPSGMDQAFCHASQGFFVQISVTSDFKYTTTQVPYMTFDNKMTDDQFLDKLDKMESLYEQVIPSSITEEVDKQVKEYSDAIYRQYVSPRVASQGVPQGTAPINFSQPVSPSTGVPVYSAPTTSPTVPVAPAPVTTVSTRPACFGNHQVNNPTCICCPCEVECIQATGPSSEDTPF